MFLHADLHSAIFSSAYISCWAPRKLVSFLTTTLILNMELAIWLILKGYFMKRKKNVYYVVCCKMVILHIDQLHFWRHCIVCVHVSAVTYTHREGAGCMCVCIWLTGLFDHWLLGFCYQQGYMFGKVPCFIYQSKYVV